MTNKKVQQLMKDLKDLKYNWGSGSDRYTSEVINKENIDRVEQVIRAFLIDNRDNEHVALRAAISALEAKVFMYEQIISKSNFAPMLCENSTHEKGGVMTKVGFHPERLKEATPKIEAMVNELPDEFKPTGGGGMSFMNACMDKNGNHWAEHSTIDQLVCLGIASGKLQYLMPREMWSVLPGGMPYLVVS